MRPRGSLIIALSVSIGLSWGPALADAIDGALDAALAEPAPAADTYPHVTELETYILGQTYLADPLPARLARMEKKAFGAVSTDSDLSARTDALTDYADKKLGKKMPVATDDMDSDTTDSAAAGGAAPADSSVPPSNYPHITALEDEILGQSYPQDALAARITRMETKAFGAPSTDTDLSNRTDALEAYAEKKLHKKSFDKQQEEVAESEGRGPATAGDGTTGGGGKAKALLNFVGNQLLGMAMPVPVRMIPASAVQQQDPEAPARPPEDPAIYSETPPPSGARMITQVGWCEMRIFGQTAPQLHLIARLEQLNRVLNFAPNQTGSELMDDLPKLMQAVQARPAPNAGDNP